MVGIDKMSGVLEDGRKRQGRGEGGRSTEVELVCHDLPRKCIRHHCHVLERHLGGREVGREGGREGGREEGVGEHDRITSKPRLPLLFFPPSLPPSLHPHLHQFRIALVVLILASCAILPHHLAVSTNVPLICAKVAESGPSPSPPLAPPPPPPPLPPTLPPPPRPC